MSNEVVVDVAVDDEAIKNAGISAKRIYDCLCANVHPCVLAKQVTINCEKHGPPVGFTAEDMTAIMRFFSACKTGVALKEGQTQSLIELQKFDG